MTPRNWTTGALQLYQRPARREPPLGLPSPLLTPYPAQQRSCPPQQRWPLPLLKALVPPRFLKNSVIPSPKRRDAVQSPRREAHPPHPQPAPATRPLPHRQLPPPRGPTGLPEVERHSLPDTRGGHRPGESAGSPPASRRSSYMEGLPPFPLLWERLSEVQEDLAGKKLR